MADEIIKPYTDKSLLQKSDSLYRISAFQYHETLDKIMDRDVHICRPDDTIRKIAEKMAGRRISSVIVTDSKLSPRGIVTERDIVRKVVADHKGHDTNRKVSGIMTPDPICLPPEGSLFDALSLISKHSIKHLPIVKEDRVIGIVTLRQILKIRYAEPSTIIGQLTDARTAKAFKAIKDELIYLVKEKQEASFDPVDIITMLSLINAGIHKRLLKKTIDEYGRAPDVEYSFFVTGSHGRKENLLFPDQDFCVIIDDYDKSRFYEIDSYFFNISKKYSDMLNEAGFAYCPGNVMGQNPIWRKSISEWLEQISMIMSGKEEHTVRFLTLIFDSSHLFGSKLLFEKYKDYAFMKISSHHNIIRQMHSEEEGKHKVPLGFFNTFITEKDAIHKKEIDMKKSGLIFMIEAARILALNHRIRETSTLGRIQALVENSVIKKDDSEYFENAYRVILDHTLEAQVDNYLAKGTNDYYIAPHKLSHRNQHVLKEAFKAISRLQDIVRYDFGEL